MMLSSEVAAHEFFRTRNPRTVGRDRNIIPLAVRQARAYQQVTDLLVDGLRDGSAVDLDWGLRLAFPGHRFVSPARRTA